MKKNYLLCMACAMSSFFYAQTIFINEIHYANAGADVNEGIEIAGPAGTDLSGYEVRLYNSSGDYYESILNLYGIIPNQQNNLGTLWFDKAGIQNGPSDGFVLIDASGNLVQFLSYQGTVLAEEGVANGLTSVDIGVSESDATTPDNYSLQLIGTGKTYLDFTWSGPIAATPGLPNTSQTLPIVENTIENFKMYPNPVVNGEFSISSNSKLDANVEINTLLGEQVYKKNVKATENIKISNLKNGVYILKVEQEGKRAIKKIIIQ
ncbi:T9SS type A sorting domain-containing protein [Lutibacter sp.]|uniref:T9SS type A sorting domain-containing protein n=1 Tax=Lutibacter sp. TaxID=1925666 RepID=UPI001A1C7AC1|nr:T9SS type A sorting domain-containing protein [Lutibacter sp.]MBI9040820.1 T9SS type A sorting domain-containing protein [Lutibacter sp.]